MKNKKENVELTIKDKQNVKKFAQIFYDAIMHLDDDSLILHYHQVRKELEKRGVLCSKL